MRRIPALLCVAGLAAAPASVAAGPSHDPWSSSPQIQTVEKFEWSTAKGRLGMMVMGLTPELRKHFGAPGDRGVLVAHVEAGTPAAAAGIEVGDVIVGVRGKPIESAPDVLSALADARKGAHAAIEVVRDGKSRTVEATLGDDAMASDWMTPFDMHRMFSTPFDSWTHDQQTSSMMPTWFDRLRELFAPNPGPTWKHS